MPLGLMPGMAYEEKEVTLERGESVLFYSDGLVEAHDPQGEMFGFPRLRSTGRGPRRGEVAGGLLMDELPPSLGRVGSRRTTSLYDATAFCCP